MRRIRHSFSKTVFVRRMLTMLLLFVSLEPIRAQDQQEAETLNQAGDSTALQVEEIELLPPTPWILRPYAVQVQVAIERHPLLDNTRQPQFLQQVHDLLRAEVHQMWDVEVVPASDEFLLAPKQLESLTGEAITESKAIGKFDKVFLTTLSQQTGLITIATREWDDSSRNLGSYHTQSTWNSHEVAPQLAANVLEAFRPFAEVETVGEDTTEFLIRGGEFFARNPEMQQFQPGEYLVPYLRYLDRERIVQKIQFLPWTFLKVEEVDRSRISASVISAFQNPIAAARRRVEIRAMRIRPHLPSTEVLIYPRGSKLNPLVGYRCEVMSRIPTEEDPVEDRLELITNRSGIVTVPADKQSPIQFLYVYSGQALLAKVPLIPGYAPRLEIEVPDDSHRLNVEGEVSLMQSQLIDLVATREVLMARARGASATKNWSDVARFINDLQALPTQMDFNTRIEAIQVGAVYEARQAKDRVAEYRIKKLCDGIRTSVEKHIDPLRIAEFRREMDEIKRLDK